VDATNQSRQSFEGIEETMFIPISNEAEPEPFRFVPISSVLCSSIQNGRHVGLDFYDLLIEAGFTATCR
jgi:hypothetical protein